MATELPRWVEREFAFELAIEFHPNIRSRLRGAPARLEEALSGLPLAARTFPIDGAWTIQENAGHLLELEPLHQTRLDEILGGARDLSPADMTNRATDQASYDLMDGARILEAFRETRTALVERLDGLSLNDFERSAIHPRLRRPMRLIDLIWFVAEHDDHHLGRIEELKRSMARNASSR